MTQLLQKAIGLALFACITYECEVVTYIERTGAHPTCPKCGVEGPMVRRVTSEYLEAISLAKTERGKQDAPQGDVS